MDATNHVIRPTKISTTEKMRAHKLIHKFHIPQLSQLLSAFNYSTIGDKTILRNRALSLLHYIPKNFDYQAYLNKISYIYLDTDISIQQLTRTPFYQYEQQTQNLPQSTYTPRATISPIQRGTYTHNRGKNHQNNNIQNSIQLAGLYASPQIHSRQQTNAVVNNVNSFIPSARSLANVNFKNIPFVEIIAETIKITALVGCNRCSIQNCPKEMREAQFKFSLSPEQVALLTKNRDVSNEKNGYAYQLQIRISLFERGCTAMNDYLPLGLYIRLNNNACPLPKNALTKKNQQDYEARRILQPINCFTENVELEPFTENTIIVNWIPDVKNYVMGMYLVKNLTSEVLIHKLHCKVPRSIEEIKSMIRKNSVNADPDVANTSYFCSLICPIGQIRVKIPAKSTNCNHLQCFDARTYILMNEKTPTWMCPICNKPCLYDDILIESYFLEVISNPKLPHNCNEIEILADGSWKACEGNKEIVEMSDEEKHNHNRKRLKESENMKSIIDLTSSDEESTEKKDEQKNEVRVASYNRRSQSTSSGTVTTSRNQLRLRKGKQPNIPYKS